MKRRIKLVGLIVMISLALASCSRRTPMNVADRGWTLDNKQHVKLSDYQGKVLLLDFYATWCGPCRNETPHLVRLQSQYADKGFQVIGLNVGGDGDLDRVPGYAKEFNVQYPLASPDDDLVKQFLSDNQNIPQSFIFDRHGKLIKRFIGYGPRSSVELDQILGTIMEGTASDKVSTFNP